MDAERAASAARSARGRWWRVIPHISRALGAPTGLLDRDIAPARKFRYDRLYIRRRSMGLDLRLILLSVVITLRGSWERRGRKR